MNWLVDLMSVGGGVLWFYIGIGLFIGVFIVMFVVVAFSLDL